MVDATVGHGGHSFLFGKRLGPAGTVVGFDLDSRSLERARERLAALSCKVILLQSNFARVAERLAELEMRKVDFILADLGLHQIRLMTNNPRKITGLEGYGIEVVERVHTETKPNKENIEYLKVKAKKMGHLLSIKTTE